MRTCLHCVLHRVLARVRAPVSVAAGPPVRVPLPAGTVYRALRGLVTEAGVVAPDHACRIAVVDVGRRDVDVVLTLRRPNGRSIVLTRAFARYVIGALPFGFTEGDLDAIG